jgi:hypothetical protein
MCQDAARPKLLLSLDQTKIAEIDLETRSQKVLLEQRAIPMSAFTDSGLLLGFVSKLAFYVATFTRTWKSL